MRARPIEERFWEKVVRDIDTGCWEWTGCRMWNGYGIIHGIVGNSYIYCHRLAYELCIGPIPNGLTVDHLCKNRGCVNPSHLDPVTFKENVLRGDSPSAVGARSTHCKNGHLLQLSPFRSLRGSRYCPICKKESEKKWRQENGDHFNSYNRSWYASHRSHVLAQRRERARAKKQATTANMSTHLEHKDEVLG
jgi:hypothetical protein